MTGRREHEDAPLADPGSFRAVEDQLATADPLGFEGYVDSLTSARSRTGIDESVRAGAAKIGGIDVELTFFHFDFLGGSLGEVAGERIARSLRRAATREVPFVLRTSTGGARMQEGMRALVQMPKMVSARLDLADSGQPFIALLGHPTTGGVLASIAGLADVSVVEADATIGFAGPRVAERFTGDPLPSRSHTAASAYSHGLVDGLVPESETRTFVVEALRTLAPDRPASVDPLPRVEMEPTSQWDALNAARAPDRPRASDLGRAVCEAFVELRGDRAGTDDPALMAGIGRVAGRRLVILAMDRDVAPGPGAYRKTRRCLRIASRLRLPVVSLIDTRGADPSAGSEAGGIAWEIAATFEAMLRAESPTIAVVTGEGGSGGALALATADELIAYYDSVFSVIAPEGAAEILWRDGGRASDAAMALKITAADLRALGIADRVVEARLDHGSLEWVIAAAIDRVGAAPDDYRAARRRERWATK